MRTHTGEHHNNCFKTCALLIGFATMVKKRNRYKAKCKRTPMNTTTKMF